MAKFLVKHKVSFGTGANARTFYFVAPPDHYTGIAAAAGITKVPDNDDEQKFPVCTLGELLLSPVMTRRVIKYTKAGRTRYAKVAIASTKAATFENDLGTGAYKGGQITGVHEPLDATFY